MRALSIALLVAASWSLGARSARADAVPGPPHDCPAGAIGTTGHNGAYCTPAPCKTDADCKDSLGFDERARVCKELALCVVARQEDSRSGWSHGTPLTLLVAGSECPDGTCAEGACERGKHCVLAEAASPPPTTPPPSTTPPTTPPPSTAPPSTTPPSTTSTSTPKGCTGCSVADPSPPLALLALLFLARRRPVSPTS